MAQQQPFFPQELLLHTLLRNRYFILSEVGAGGFGWVYKARDIQSGDRLVAIKEVRLLGLHPKAMLEATSAFQREASVLSQLDHPNLPRLYEHFQNPGHWYLVMDFIAGETLEQYQSKAPNGRLLLSEVLDIGLQLCIVLDYLHSQQPPIVFRDLKPANIMRTPTGQLYLIDFGIARYFKPGQAKDTVALLRPKNPQSHSDAGSLTTSMVDVLVNKLEILIASMLDMDVNKRPPDVASVKHELHVLSTLWSDIRKSFWRPKLGYTQKMRN